MGKKNNRSEKMLLKMQERRAKYNKEDSPEFVFGVYTIADAIRTMAQSSAQMNEFSEAFDNMLVKLTTLKPEEVLLLQRLW